MLWPKIGREKKIRNIDCRKPSKYLLLQKAKNVVYSVGMIPNLRFQSMPRISHEVPTSCTNMENTYQFWNQKVQQIIYVLTHLTQFVET